MAVQSELIAAMDIINENEFSKKFIRNYLRMLKYKKRAHNTNVTIVMRQSLYKAQRKAKKLFIQTLLRQNYHPEVSQQDVILLENGCSQQAIITLKEAQSELSPTEEHFALKNSIIHQIMLEYKSKIDRIKNYQIRQKDEYQTAYQEFFLKTLDEERNVIQSLLEQGKISADLANQLRQSVNYNETTFIQGSIDVH